jgi:predicted nuclease of predicted toxin-antitoxin system
LKFLLDANLPAAFARALDALARNDGDTVMHVSDLVDAAADDRVWIAALADQPGSGVAISGDKRMLTRKHELFALRQHRITIFILAPACSAFRFWEKAALLVGHWPRITAAAKSSDAGSIFVVPPGRNASLKRGGAAPPP